jgi:hypothetical protein
MENVDVVDTTKQSVDTQNSNLVDTKIENNSPKVFDEAYVKELRAEAKSKGQKLKEYESKLTEFENAKLEAEKNALIEQGKFEELYKKEQLEKAELLNKISEYEPIVSQYQESINKKRAELIETLPENMRQEFAELGIEKLELLAKQFQNVNRNSIGNLPIENNTKPNQQINISKGLVLS